MGVIVGIDCSNVRSGGGLTYLVELLTALDLDKHAISRIVLWGGAQTIEKLPDRPWLELVNPPVLNQGLLQRMWWQRFNLSRAARLAQCDILFVPGGSYAGDFRPMVAMSHNLLPFEFHELRRYIKSSKFLKYLLLRHVQSRTFRTADGVLFLANYSMQAVLKVTGKLGGRTAVIPHGMNPRFLCAPRACKPVEEYSDSDPLRIVYVSIIDVYKHQWHVVEAVHTLRAEGFSLALDLVGPAYPPAKARLLKTIARLDPEDKWVRYHGEISYDALHLMHARADIGVFASSCENLPLTLLETMAAGLPVASSNRGPMPEVLGDAGLYFDPEDSADIALALRRYIQSHTLRNEKAKLSFELSGKYSWERCAEDTFSFIEKTI